MSARACTVVAVRQPLLSVALVLATLSCGTEEAPPFDDTHFGTVSGREFVLRSAYIYHPPHDDRPEMTGLVLSDQADACAKIQRFVERGDSANLDTLLAVATDNGGIASMTPGNYTAIPNDPDGPGKYAFGKYNHLDAFCADTVDTDDGRAQRGTIHVDAVTIGPGGELRGTIDLTIGTQGDTLRGRFVAPWCDVPYPSQPFTCE